MFCDAGLSPISVSHSRGSLHPSVPVSLVTVQFGGSILVTLRGADPELRLRAKCLLFGGGGQAPRGMLQLLVLAQRMRETLRNATGRVLYRLRKSTVEPVSGRIKEIRGFRRFAFTRVEQ